MAEAIDQNDFHDNSIKWSNRKEADWEDSNLATRRGIMLVFNHTYLCSQSCYDRIT